MTINNTADKQIKRKDAPKSDKLPALQFYPGDWKKDLGIQSLDFFDRHVWFEMLLLMHESEERGVLVINGKPVTEEMLARMLGLDKQILSKSLENIKNAGVCGVREDGAIFSRRMVRDEDIRSKRIKAGSMGGSPVLLKQNSSKTRANVKQNTEDEVEDENEDEDEDLKKKTAAPLPEPPTEIEPPPKSEFDTPEARQALGRWQQYAKTSLRKHFEQLGADTLMMRYSGRPKDFIRDINGSISSGWHTVRDCSGLEKQAFAARAGPEPINWEIKKMEDREAAKAAHRAKVIAYLEKETQ